MTAKDPMPLATGEQSVQAPTELASRIVSALVLAAIALALTYAGPWPFAVLVAVGGLVTAWEWGRLVRGPQLDVTLVVHGAAVVAAALLATAGSLQQALLALAAGVLTAGVLGLRTGTARWSALGVVYLGAAAASAVLIRGDAVFGWQAILFLFAIVWCTDTAAFAVGRTLGGPKLAPRISPGKTWSGFLGGLAAAALVGLGAAWLIGGTSPVLLALVALALSLLAQLGDLAESGIKRAFGAKDASHLIPGHGGLLDRIDSFVFAVVGAALLGMARDGMHPGQALLMWP